MPLELRVRMTKLVHYLNKDNFFINNLSASELSGLFTKLIIQMFDIQVNCAYVLQEIENKINISRFQVI